jgi:diaminohydroxyphosphoribosylaminopyrimidine deaminase/5-amino-6-(5-phosphoribosylamino)uracil reductase
MNHDQQWMAHALAQAETAIYRTRPNPAVGCVIVKDDIIIGRGATAPVGGPHAEVSALREAQDLAQNATAYVTLEPCAHYGRTPPCAEALVRAGLKKVVIATLDPNPLVAGKGVALLAQAGIETQIGVLEAQAQAQNRGFLKVMAGGLPYVRLKIAASLDGRTAMASGESKWISGVESRQEVQHWRAISGAVITGVQTILADDALLNVRQLPGVDVRQIPQPWRIILDRQGRLPLEAKILQDPYTVMVMGPYRAELAALGVLQLPVQSLTDLLYSLKAQHQIYDVLLECGATLASSFLAEKLVDEVIQYIAPVYLGQMARPLNQLNYQFMQQCFQMKLLEVTQIQQDIRVRLQPIYEQT